MATKPFSAIDDSAQRTVIAGLSAVLFFITLVPIDAIPEIPVDIDQKPFFVPLTLVALLPAGRTSLAVGFGAALGEAMRDVLEGYEVDDTFGFVGYVVAFTIAGFVIGRHPSRRGRLVTAALACALVQASFEGAAFALLGADGVAVAIESTIGNTVTHGVIGGAIPLVLIVPRFAGRLERFLGFEPKEWAGPDPLADAPAPSPSAAGTDDAPVALDRFTFAYPGTSEPALRDVTLRLAPGEVAGVVGAEGSGRTTLGMALAGLLPAVTGGPARGRLRVLGREPFGSPGGGAAADLVGPQAAMVFEDPESQLTQVHAADEVRAALRNRGVDGAALERRAAELFEEVGLAPAAGERRVWQLPTGDRILVTLAAALAVDPAVLVLDNIAGPLDDAGRARLADLARRWARDRVVVVIDDDVEVLAGLADRVVVLGGGRVVADGPVDDVLADEDTLRAAGVATPVAARLGRELGVPVRPLSLDGLPVGGGTGVARAAGRTVARVDELTVVHEDGTTALDGVSLDLRAGEVHAVVGARGSGKSTLVSAIAGLTTPTSGRIEVAGRDLTSRPAKERWGLVGAVLADPDRQLTEETVTAEIGFAAGEVDGLNDLDGTDAAALADLVGFRDDQLGADPRLLPRGQRRLTALASALARRPALLVLDEPTAGMDPECRRRLHAAVRSVRARGGAVLLTENDVDRVADVADRVTVLAGGRARHQGPAREALAAANRDALAAAGTRPTRVAEVAEELGVAALRWDELVEALGSTKESPKEGVPSHG